MDSSPSGLLSTVIMTIPLVIVPAIALFRPPSLNTGVAVQELEGAEDQDLLSEFGLPEPSGPKNAPSEPKNVAFRDDSTDDTEWFDEVNGEVLEKSEASDPHLSENKSPLQSDPFSEDSAAQQEDSAAAEQNLLRQLTEIGALKTLWFSATGPANVGCAAFFSANTESQEATYRFEAVGHTKLEALRDVYRQALDWKTRHPSAPHDSLSRQKGN